MDARATGAAFAWPDLHGLDDYVRRRGYEAARRAVLGMTPAEVVALVSRADLRGRGGAGFPAGRKWSFIPAGAQGPRYLCANADEGEPGTFKDRAVLWHNPHAVLEGMIIASYAVGAHDAFVYIRGEYEAVARRLEDAAREAAARGFLGTAIFGSRFDLRVVVHRGAGAYICGEETALLESLEGKRGLPRLKPPFPAVVGLFRAPTVVNNVETLACVPSIVLDGPEAFLARGAAGDGGTRLLSVSGAVRKPGIYECPSGARLDEVVALAGGPPEGRRVKAVIPGGLSAPVLRADELATPMSVQGLAARGSMLGSGGIIVIDDATPMMDVLRAVARFYARESCGQCTPCRIGTAWVRKIVERIDDGDGEPSDLHEIRRLAAGMTGRTLCPLGDAAALPLIALVDKFGDELRAAVRSLAEAGPGPAGGGKVTA